MLLILGISSSTWAFDAALKRTSGQLRDELYYATKYHILVSNLDPAIPYDRLVDLQTFEVTNKETRDPIPVKRVSGIGFIDGNGRYSGAYLWGDFRSGVVYIVRVRYPP